MRFEKQVRDARILGIGVAAVVLLSSAVTTIADDVPTDYPPTATLQEIEQRIRDCKRDHPRLFVTQSQLEQLAASVAKDPLCKKIAAVIVAQADSLLETQPVERQLEGRRLLGVSRTCLDRVLTLATAYHLTADARYVERCQSEMLAAARFKDWNPSHYLDVAEMTFGLAIGYDWLYDQLDPASREEIRRAIVEKGVQLQFDSNHASWVRRTNNWGQVCHGGMTVGALAVLEHEPELAAKTVYSAIHNVTVSMKAYAPNGGYPEGPSYWSYGTSYNVALIAAVESVLGNNFGLVNAPGFRKTATFPVLACGPSGLYFNYCDGRPERGLSPISFWFAKRFGNGELQRNERAHWELALSSSPDLRTANLGRFWQLALIWMGGARPNASNTLPLSWSSGGSVPITVHRSSWTDLNATFVGLKAGSPSGSHGHMDIGSFVFDSDGVRWAIDLGVEGYHGIESRGMGLWNRSQDGDRWKIFRLNNFSHNTLVINGQLQHADGDASIIQFSDDSTRTYSIVDMSSVYAGQAESARRGVMLHKSREILVQDELTGLKEGSRVRWQMVTPGIPERPGQKSLVLRQDGQRLQMAITMPPSLAWTQVETEQPPNSWDSPNPGTRMVAFEAVAPASGKLTLAVTLTPGTCTNPVAAKERIMPLAEWDTIRLNGK